MSIFIIKQAQNKPAGNLDASAGTTPILPASSDNKVPEKPIEETKDEFVSVQKEVSGEPQINSTPNTSENTDQEPEEKVVKVSINGPIGKAFTEALNQLLVTESYMTMMPVLKEQQQGSIAGNDMLQVYCWDGDDIDLQDLTQLTNNISKNKDQQFVIAVENIRTVRKVHTLIDQLPIYGNVTVCYSRERALQAIKDKLS